MKSQYPNGMTYKEASMELGVDHHYVRKLVREGKIRIVGEEEACTNVDRKLLSTADIETYRESRRVWNIVTLALDDDDYAELNRIFRNRVINHTLGRIS